MRYIKKILLLLFILFLFSSLLKNIFNYQNKLQFYQDFKQDYENEKQKNIALKTDVLKKKSMSELEKTIRNKLNLLRPDEVAVSLPSPTPAPVTITPTPLPNYLQWWQVFLSSK